MFAADAADDSKAMDNTASTNAEIPKLQTHQRRHLRKKEKGDDGNQKTSTPAAENDGAGVVDEPKTKKMKSA